MASNVTEVNIRNGAETIAALKDFDAKAGRALDRGLRKAVRPLVRKAQADVPDAPLFNWAWYGWIEKRAGRNKAIRERDLMYVTTKVRSGIRIQLGGKRQRGRIVSNLVGIKNANAAGAIYELAGSKTPDNRLARSLRVAGHGGPKRLVLKQDTPSNRAAVQRDVAAAMREAEQQVQRQLDGMR